MYRHLTFRSCAWRNRCCPPGNMNSKSKQESKLLWQYYRCKVFPWGLTLILKTTLNISAWVPFYVWTWICLLRWGFRAAARMRKRDYVMLTSKYSPSWNALLPLTECGEPYLILLVLAPLALIYKRGPTLRSTISWRLERGHNSQTSQNMQYVKDMWKRTD